MRSLGSLLDAGMAEATVKRDPVAWIKQKAAEVAERAEQGLTDGNRQTQQPAIPAFPVGLLPRIWRQGRRVCGSCAVGVAAAIAAVDMADD